MGAPTYKQLAERSISQAADQLNSVPKGEVRTDVMAAHAAMAQALASIAAAQALLDIGDLIRKRVPFGGF